MDTPQKSTILITCAPRLIEYLHREVEELGFTVQLSHNTGVEIIGTLDDTMKLNLCLRTALAVQYLLKEFNCTNPDELYRQTLLFQWEDVVGADEYLCVTSRTNTPTINNPMFASLKVKDAIVDRISQKTGERPDYGPKRDHILVHLHWKKDKCRLFLNTSGRILADRSYRKMPYNEPMQETLAAGIILATDYNGEVPFVVPMCGSGTLATEAALIALHRAPGLLRSNFGFMHVKDFDKQKWQNLHKEVLKTCRKQLPARIIATDIDEEAIKSAKKNARTAGLEHLIEFYTCDFVDTPIPPEKGIIIFNPESGKRLVQKNPFETTYRSIGDFLKQKCPGYTGYILTANISLAKKVGLRTRRRLRFFNGDTECRLLKYQMYR